MNVAFKQEMKLTAAKKLLKEFKQPNCQVRRGSSNSSCSLIDARGRSATLIFKSNLELKNLIK